MQQAESDAPGGAMSENTVSELSQLTTDDGNRLVGQTIARVEASEFGLILTFTDGSKLEVSGNTFGGCALSVDYSVAQ